MDSMRLQINVHANRTADEATEAFLKAFEAFEKEVAEPLARLESERDGFRDALHPLMRETAVEKAKRHIEELELVAAERDEARAEVARLRGLL
jgi:hypothetical protein